VCDALQAHAFDWVVLPSQNAGRALVSDLHTARIVCGVATARALGLSAEVVIQKFSASAALEAMRPLIRPGQRVLMPRAAEGREELLDGLRALGAVVSTPVAYRTVAIDTAAACLRTRQVDVLTLCSPSAVASLMGALPQRSLKGWPSCVSGKRLLLLPARRACASKQSRPGRACGRWLTPSARSCGLGWRLSDGPIDHDRPEPPRGAARGARTGRYR
jgi:uroporphyrinogen-III synthase